MATNNNYADPRSIEKNWAACCRCCCCCIITAMLFETVAKLTQGFPQAGVFFDGEAGERRERMCDHGDGPVEEAASLWG